MRRHIATITVGLACLVVLAVGAVLIYEFLKDIDTKKLDNPTKTTTESHVVVTLGTKSPALDAMSSVTSTTNKATTATPLATGKHEGSSIWSSGRPVSSVSSIKNSSGNKTTATASPDKTSSTERATTAASSVMTRTHERSSTGSSGQPPTSVFPTYSAPSNETTAIPSPEKSSTTERSTTAVTSPEIEQHGNSSVLTSSSAHPSKTAQPLTTSQPMTTSSTNSNSNANETTTETTTFPSNQKETGSTPDTAITVSSFAKVFKSLTTSQTRMPIEDLFPGQPLHALWEDSQRDSD